MRKRWIRLEKWKDVKGYEGIYEVSDHGKVKTKKGKTTYTARHGERVWKERVLKQKIDKKGYKRVSLWKEGKSKTSLVHRLVADAFIENPHDEPMVNHKDGNPSNNKVENLEWCDSKHNVNHAFDNGLMYTVEIVLKSQKTGEEKEFRSMKEASLFMGRSHGYVSGLLKKGKREADGYEIILKEERMKSNSTLFDFLRGFAEIGEIIKESEHK